MPKLRYGLYVFKDNAYSLVDTCDSEVVLEATLINWRTEPEQFSRLFVACLTLARGLVFRPACHYLAHRKVA